MRIIFTLACLVSACHAQQIEASSAASSKGLEDGTHKPLHDLAMLLLDFNVPSARPRSAAATFYNGFRMPSALESGDQRILTPSSDLASLHKKLLLSRTAKPMMTSSIELNPRDAVLARGCSAGWLALTIPSLTASKPLMTDIFGLDQSTFEANIREPAAGLLEITSTLFPLEALLLLALASSSEVFRLEDRSRVGAGLALSSLGVLTTLALATAGGLAVSNPAAVIAFVVLNLATAVVAWSASCSVEAPLELYQSDLANVVFNSDGAKNSFASFFYRSSILAGLVVGASFIVSPVSPIAVFDEELPVTHMLRQDLGVYVAFLLCTIQAILYRAAQAEDLGQNFIRALNVVTGFFCSFLVLDGEAQVKAGAAAFAQLEPGDPLLSILAAAGVAGSGGSRAEVNTAAAFYTGISVGLVYLLQAVASKPSDEN